MQSYKAEELFDSNGRLSPKMQELAPKKNRRLGSNPHTNDGVLLCDLIMPDFHEPAVTVTSPGAIEGQGTMVLAKFLRDVARLNQCNFRVFGPDENLSDLLRVIFEATDRQWDAQEIENDEIHAPIRRVLDPMLSERPCKRSLEGYLLTGRHGLFNSDVAMIRIVDSMFSQHAKWFKVMLENDGCLRDIERCLMVGNKQWRHAMTVIPNRS